MSIISSGLIAILAVTILSVIYRLLPHRTPSKTKPILAFFPKYVFQHSGKTEIRNSLAKIGFQESKRKGVFVRGYYLGDLSVKLSRLNVVIDGEAVFLHSPLFVILFDTGDLWRITASLFEQSGKITTIQEK